MIYLLLSILSSTILFVVFKLFNRFKVDRLQAIVVNYVTAAGLGLVLYKGEVSLSDWQTQPWLPYAACLGALFIAIFNLMALTTQRLGLSVVSVATKMSLVVPIVFGLFYYRESAGTLRIIGIITALISVYLVTVKEGGFKGMGRRGLLLPALVFLGSGVIDTSLKYLEERFVPQEDVPLFSAMIFGSAALFGLAILTYRYLSSGNLINARSIIGGLALGIPNYFSVFFLIRALKSGLLESSGIFTVNNVAIVVGSTLIGVWAFSERPESRNWLGVILAVLSILAVSLG